MIDQFPATVVLRYPALSRLVCRRQRPAGHRLGARRAGRRPADRPRRLSRADAQPPARSRQRPARCAAWSGRACSIPGRMSSGSANGRYTVERQQRRQRQLAVRRHARSRARRATRSRTATAGSSICAISPPRASGRSAISRPAAMPEGYAARFASERVDITRIEDGIVATLDGRASRRTRRSSCAGASSRTARRGHAASRSRATSRWCCSRPRPMPRIRRSPSCSCRPRRCPSGTRCWRAGGRAARTRQGLAGALADRRRSRRPRLRL